VAGRGPQGRGLKDFKMTTYTITTDKTQIQFARVHAWLAESYWAEGLPAEILERAIENSLCFSAFDNDTQTQIGFARIVTDYATYAYLCDVIVAPEARGRGVGKALMQAICNNLTPMDMRRWSLVTRDAHALYEQFGFIADTEGKHMSRILRKGYLD
jgi:GNAT superfamily N-acetyltransferase